jgi:hypothetical protein
MSLPQKLLKQMQCCLGNDEHIVIHPVLLSCGGNACKDCVDSSNKEIINCLFCIMDHKKSEIIKSPNNQIVETIIQSFLPDVFQDLNKKLDSVNNSLKSFFKLYFFLLFIIN